jgi:hypothetical protein
MPPPTELAYPEPALAEDVTSMPPPEAKGGEVETDASALAQLWDLLGVPLGATIAMAVPLAVHGAWLWLARPAGTVLVEVQGRHGSEKRSSRWRGR